MQRLIFHLPGEQSVLFNDEDNIEQVVQDNTEKNKMFTAWMEDNKRYGDGRNLTYGEFPIHFVYHVDKRE